MIAETFQDGLLITGIGMGLVFLTLIIVMYVIKLLDWAFKPKQETRAAEAVAAPVVAPVAAAAPAADNNNVALAAAAGVALALQQARERSVAVAATAVAAMSQVVYRSPAGSPKPWDEGIDYEDNVDGEVVTVIDIESGPGTWKGAGRVQALQQ